MVNGTVTVAGCSAAATKWGFDMKKVLKLALAATAVAFTATPALAVGPSDKNATATARVVKPLTLSWQRDLDLGTIVLGPGSWSGASVGITRAGVFSCANAN